MVKLACHSALFARRHAAVSRKIVSLTMDGVQCKAGSTPGGMPCVKYSPTKKMRVAVSSTVNVYTRKSLPRKTAKKARISIAKYKMSARKQEYEFFTGSCSTDGNHTDDSSVNPMYEYESDSD